MAVAVTGRVFTLLRPTLLLSILSKSNRVNSLVSIAPKLNHSTFHILNISRKICTSKSRYFSSHATAMSALSPLDPSSYSRPEIAVVRHTSLSLNVDFEKKVLSGSALITVDVLEDTGELILDTSNLTINSIELEDGTALKYTLGDDLPNYGSKLTIKLPTVQIAGESNSPILGCVAMALHNSMYQIESFPATTVASMATIRSEPCCSCDVCRRFGPQEPPDVKSRHKINIEYSSSESASALQWLDPSQTSGKKHPYLFSQCQPIHARSILPCQDTPAVKFTYDAEVTAPEEFTVLMSALKGENRGAKATFKQPVPIPAYLLAIAVGVLESRELGPRSKVWSEKEEIERSAWEFADTEKYLQAAERLCGPYVWTQYDLLVLPPSFPYGGMENPCLTFVTPTLLAGDRSLADVIVHEIMHSWTGNLVTNRNFEHFWLNEGFTVFLERKVGASLINDSAEAKRSRDFHSLLGLQELSEAVNSDLGATNPLTQLVVNLKGVHPDDAFSTVPYEKGSLFLRYLEDLLGGPEIFDDFLRSYLNHFARKSLDTDQFKTYLLKYFSDGDKLSAVDWSAWLHTPGMPPVIPEYDTSMTKAITRLLAQINENHQFSYDDIKAFSPHQLIHLQQELIDRPPLPIDSLRSMGQAYKLDTSKNTEIKYRWLRLCIRSKDLEKLPEALDFVNQQGRMKYVRPIYRDLYAWEEVRQEAINNFLGNEKYMMHVSAYTLRKDLHLN